MDIRVRGKTAALLGATPNPTLSLQRERACDPTGDAVVRSAVGRGPENRVWQLQLLGDFQPSPCAGQREPLPNEIRGCRLLRPGPSAGRTDAYRRRSRQGS